MAKKNVYSIIHLVISAYIAATGLFIIFWLSATHFHFHMVGYYTAEFARFSRTFMLLAGLLLVYISRQIFRYRQNAFYIVLFLLILLILLNLFHFHPWQLCIYIVGFILLIVDRKNYRVKSDIVSLRQGILSACLVFAATLIYATVGFYFIEHKDLGQDFSISQAFIAALKQLFTFGGQAFTPFTHHGRWFLNSVDAAGIFAIVLAVTSLFRPLQFILSSPDSDRKRAKEILEDYSDSTEDFFKLWPKDKHYFFWNKAFLAYKVRNGVALILDGPSGMKSEFKKLIESFLAFSYENGWLVSVIHAKGSLAELLKTFSFNRIFIGQEALVNTEKFVNEIAGDKHFRYIRNKAGREGLSFELWNPPLTEEKINQLERITYAWKGKGSRKEYTFIMAPFSWEYMRDCQVAVVLKDNKPLAYANRIPGFLKDSATIDHLRHEPGAPSVTMHFLFLNLIGLLRQRSILYFNLGFSPLAKAAKDNNAADKTLSITQKLTNFIYASEGLQSFKNHYKPEWEDKYIYYQNGLSNLLQTGLALNKAVGVKTDKTVASWLRYCSVAAAILYSAFFAGYLLSLPNAGKGYVSLLSIRGESYSWLFNTTDVLSGIIMVFIAGKLWQRLDQKTKSYKFSLVSFFLAGLGTILAILFPLPDAVFHWFFSRNVIMHNLFSFLGSGGLILSAAFVSFHLFREKKYFSLINIISIAFLLSGLAAFVFFLLGSPALTERIFISLSSLWIIIFTFYFADK